MTKESQYVEPALDGRYLPKYQSPGDFIRYIGEKRCGKCRETKPLKQFYDSRSGLGGKRWDCIACHRAYQRWYRKLTLVYRAN